MKILILGSSIVLLSLLLVTGFVGASFSQNQTNMTSMQENETQPQQKPQESGTASGIENLTGGGSGNIEIFQEGTDIANKNASVAGGMTQEQLKK
jgi:hypothetical protein